MANMRVSSLSQTSKSSRSRYTTHYTVEKKKGGKFTREERARVHFAYVLPSVVCGAVVMRALCVTKRDYALRKKEERTDRGGEKGKEKTRSRIWRGEAREKEQDTR